jgi:hypothetical protein
MRRNLLIVLLALGTVAGFSSGFAHLHAWRHHGWRHHDSHARCSWDHGHRAPDSPPPASP